MLTVKDLLSKMGTISNSDKALIEKAWAFSEQAHANQKRYSGESYFTHPVATAFNLAELGMAPTLVVAGLLHDTIEDAGVLPETLEADFGKEIAFLVDGVTKISTLRYRGDERHVESLRKLFVAMAADIRVLIVKLADRLHNMRTLEHVRPDKQVRIARETLEIYAPLAERLGITKLKGELEDLAFPYLEPEEYERVKRLRDERLGATSQEVEKMQRTIMRRLAQEHIRGTVTFRVKHLYSLAKKLRRKDNDIEKIYDIAALRVLVPTVGDCYRALGIVHNIWQPLHGRVKDFIAAKKPNGYQSIHTTVFTGSGGIVEVQILTPEMHADNQYGIASHVLYKEGSENLSKPRFGWMRRLFGSHSEQSNANTPEWLKKLAGAERNDFGDANEYLEQLREDFFEHRVFAFSPKGDPVDLPIGASTIDFAYAIHSDIGDHLAGAKVNGKLVSLETPIQNGDIVEILTKTSSHPSQKWLGLVKTTQARTRIRSAIKAD